MEAIKKGDFVEIEYTGSIKDSGAIFDTTNVEDAKKAGLPTKGMAYGPIIICVGEGQLVKGLDKALEGKSVGSYTFDISAEDGFGKRDSKNLKIMAPKVFHAQQIMPEPGLQVEVDGSRGIVKTVSGGRVIVDFNHPLSGKEIVYAVKVDRIVTDDAEKIKAYLQLILRMKKEDIKAEVVGKKATVTLPGAVPPEIEKALSAEIKRVTGLESVEIKAAEKPKAEAKPAEAKPRSKPAGQ